MNNIAILVNSCDAYSDLWPHFFYLLKTNWENIEDYNIYLNTESKNEYTDDLKIRIINTQLAGKDQWGKRLINSLSTIEEEYVVVLMDDFFLRNKLYESRIVDCLSLFSSDPKVAVIYLTHIFMRSFPKSTYDGFLEIPKKTNYRLNSGPALWKKCKLLKYVKETDNPWAWEYFGTCRTNYTDDLFYCVEKKEPIYDYAHAIYRGKWLEKDVGPLVEKFNLDIDVSKRGIIKNDEILPKRDLKWKIDFISTGIKMVGFDAIKEIIRDKRNANKSQ